MRTQQYPIDHAPRHRRLRRAHPFFPKRLLAADVQRDFIRHVAAMLFDETGQTAVMIPMRMT